jgi:xanthine dehydrogenase accessory factor
MAGAIRRAIEEQRELASVTVVEADPDRGTAPGARMLVHPDGTREGSLGDPELDDAAAGEALASLRQDRAGLLTLREGVRVFVEALVPPIRLLVCGAGHDAIPLVRFAAGMGWRIEVVDDREAFLSPDRFPQASAFVASPPDEAAARAEVDARTYAVVMTHNFLRDKDYLRSLLGSPVPYIGMLGPRMRFERLLDELAREGFVPDRDDLRVVHAPAGLDLGSEGPEEIAWAIVGEVLAVRNARSGGFLNGREGSIHDRPPPAEATAGTASA